MQDELDALHTHVRLARDGLLAFTPALDAVQQVAAVEIGPAALAVLAWAWQRRAILAPHRDDLLAGLAEGWRPTAQRLMAAWDAVVRTSSAIENWHSILRPHLAVHRTLSPGLLALLAVWHNHRVFPRGVHTGLNPLHLSGLTDAPTDWLVALGYSPARTSSTHLTCPSSLSRLALAA